MTRTRRKIPTHLQKLGVAVCTKDTWDAEIVDQLKPVVLAGDEVFENALFAGLHQAVIDGDADHPALGRQPAVPLPAPVLQRGDVVHRLRLRESNRIASFQGQ